MPYPAPLICRLPRSVGVPNASRGYQPIGKAIVRPSSRSTLSVSSVTVTCTIRLIASAAAEGIPLISQNLQVLSDNPFELSQLPPAIAVVLRQCNVRIDPKFCTDVLPVNLRVSRLSAVVRVKIETIRAAAQRSRHPHDYRSEPRDSRVNV